MRIAFCTILISTVALAETVPVPKITPLPVTADSYPLNMASHDLQPLDFSKLGYTEAEFIVSGTANVYDWAADGSVTVKTPNAPYANRILVRHPSNPSRFSGTVVVELMNSARRFDWPMMWGYSHEHFIEHGDAWVGVTMPGAVQGLKKFNPTRYAAVSFANPTPGGCVTGGKNAAPDQEEGLRWDMLSQVAAALKSNASGAPMAGFKVERVFMTTQAGDIVTYINAIHSHAKLADGKPAYDGYMIKNPAGAVRINQCAPNPGQGDLRRIVAPTNVPIVAVVAQGELVANLASRHPDSDDSNGRYRLYEIAGVAHIEKYPYSALPSFADQNAAGTAQGTPDWPFNAKCDPDIPLGDDPLLKYSYDAAFLNLHQWVAKGVAPPKADRIQVKDGAVVLDEFGNGLGGVRSPFVDIPTATYFTTSPGPGTCAELGHAVHFDEARLKSLYPDPKAEANKVTQSIDRMVKERFLTEQDAKRLRADLLPPTAGK